MPAKGGGKYTPETVKHIVDDLKTGSTIKDACIRACVTEETFFTWMKKHLDFSESVKKAQTDFKKYCEKIVITAMPTTWQAAAWWLERKHRDEYALKTEMKLDANLNMPSLEQGKAWFEKYGKAGPPKEGTE